MVFDGIFLESVNIPMGLDELFGILDVFCNEFTDSSNAWEVWLPTIGEFSLAVPGGAKTIGEARIAPIFPKKPNKNMSRDGLS